MNEIAAVILAAGKSTRMKSKHPKVAHSILGKPMTQYVVDAVRAAGADQVVVIVGHMAEEVKSLLGPSVEYAHQTEQKGSGHAALQAEEALAGFSGIVLVIPGDTPMVSPESLKGMIETQKRTGAAAVMLTAMLEDAGAYGRIVRAADDSVARIVEAKDATPEILAIREINTGFFCFQADLLFEMLHKIQPNNAQGEYYLTDVVELLNNSGKRVEGILEKDFKTTLGINNRIELAEAMDILKMRVLNSLMLSGVTIEDPSTTYIESSVQIGQDTIIRPNTFLCGKTIIGEDCVIGPSAQIKDAVIGDRTIVNSSVIDDSEIGPDCKIGPWSRLRSGNKIGARVVIGNFAELKKTTVAENSHIHHVSYFGDTTMGTRVNIGAGTITCNYDGTKKSPTKIGDDAFIGSDTMLVAPVNIGNNAATGAGSVVTKDVPDNTLVVGVPAKPLREKPPKA